MHISVSKAADILRKGGIVGMPTETVYGLAAAATNDEAVAKVFKAKNRPADNPLICHFESIAQIEKYVTDISPSARAVMEYFMPGPLSVLLNLPKKSALLPATLGKLSVICRIPMHPMALELIRQVGEPIAAPSANVSGKMSGTNAHMVEVEFGNAIDGVVDGGESSVGLESTILDVRDENDFKILRPGAIGCVEIEEALADARMEGVLGAVPHISEGSAEHVTPGSKYKHYAPETPVVPVREHRELQIETSCAVIGTTERIAEMKLPKTIPTISLGSRQSISQIARSLYHAFFQLDALHVEKAYFLVEDWGASSLAKAVQNRLRKVFNA